MITIHWSLIVLIIVVGALVLRGFRDEGGFDFMGPFCLILAVLVVLIYGGIYWW